MEILAIALGEFFTHFFDICGIFISRIFLTFFEFLHFLHFWISALFTVLNFPHFFYICGIFIYHLFDNCWISRTFFTFVRFSFPAFLTIVGFSAVLTIVEFPALFWHLLNFNFPAFFYIFVSGLISRTFCHLLNLNRTFDIYWIWCSWKINISYIFCALILC